VFRADAGPGDFAPALISRPWLTFAPGTSDLNLFLALALQIFILRLSTPALLRYAPWVRTPLTRVLLTLDVTPTPDRIALTAKLLVASFWYLAHLVEAVTQTRPLMRRFGTTSPVVISLYVSGPRGPSPNSPRNSGRLVPRDLLLIDYCSLSARYIQYLATMIGGFPVWRRLRLVGERLERHLEAKKAKGH
jgi:hypothetical protein